jgi:hypothetical protein
VALAGHQQGEHENRPGGTYDAGFSENLDYGPQFAAITLLITPILIAFVAMHKPIQSSVSTRFAGDNHETNVIYALQSSWPPKASLPSSGREPT